MAGFAMTIATRFRRLGFTMFGSLKLMMAPNVAIESTLRNLPNRVGAHRARSDGRGAFPNWGGGSEYAVGRRLRNRSLPTGVSVTQFRRSHGCSAQLPIELRRSPGRPPHPRSLRCDRPIKRGHGRQAPNEVFALSSAEL